MSPIDICNQALAHIGDRRITRIDEDAQLTDPLSYYCAQFYLAALEQVLAAHRWSFAKASAVLSRRLDVTPMGGFNYVHALPTDCLRLMTLYEGSTPDGEVAPVFGSTEVKKFKIVGRNVWSNTMHLGMLYISRNEDPNEWTPHFIAAVTRLLAHYLAGAVANDPSMVQTQLNIYERVALPNAQFYDAVQDQSGENPEDRRSGSQVLMARRFSSNPYQS